MNYYLSSAKIRKNKLYFVIYYLCNFEIHLILPSSLSNLIKVVKTMNAIKSNQS